MLVEYYMRQEAITVDGCSLDSRKREVVRMISYEAVTAFATVGLLIAAIIALLEDNRH